MSRLYPGLHLLIHNLVSSPESRDADGILYFSLLCFIEMKMNLSSSESDPAVMSYLSMFAELNLSHLITELDNTTDLRSILEDNFIWPPDMR